jgi:hypothetical protein
MAQYLIKDAFWGSLFRTFFRFGKFEMSGYNLKILAEILHEHALLG